MELKRSWVEFFRPCLSQTKEGPLFEGTPCLLWQGPTDGQGYGRATINGKRYRLHRISFEEYYEYPSNTTHHRCPNTLCYNPLHLEDQTRADHMSEHMRRQFCSRGHDMDVVGRTADRHCKACRTIDRKRRR